MSWLRYSVVISFNSTTVQLILFLPTNHLTHKTSFQFHNGTINTTKKNGGIIPECRFNSTTVQLIHKKHLATDAKLQWFQFHNGTINTLTNTQKKQLKMSELANNKYAFYMINYVDG